MLLFIFFFSCSVSVFLFMLDKLVCRSAMPAGNSTAWSMEFSQMVRCLLIKQLEGGMTPSTLSSVRLEQESMSPVQYLWT